MSGNEHVLVWSPVHGGHHAFVLLLLEAPNLLRETGFPWTQGAHRESRAGGLSKHYCCSGFPGSKVV